ncbi:MAG: efflux RND transporter permease subunit [Flavobacteriales bacterium]|nr:efflux RND transporter permease subunit [Flavobacteriales bacterium]
MIIKLIKYFLDNKLVTVLLLTILVVWGLSTAPFGWAIMGLPSDPVPVDAIPDIGENQQIVFTEWNGRSPQDIEDQISYPLTTSLLGIPGVKSIRSSSMFGFSSIYIIFNEDVEFYWSRSRILEKLNSLPSGLLPSEVNPSLGPDATALGQVYWYTIEGRDSTGNVTGGWDLDEIRSVQDFYIKYGLNATDGVSEVASIGGFVREYQVDVDPNALKAYNISLHEVMKAVKNSNRDAGAKTIEINKAEYLVRGLGYIKSINDLELAVVAVNEHVPIRIKDIARVSLGPATRRGLLDKEGAEVVGGVVVARYGSNPLEVINNVKEKIAEISPGLPKRVLSDGRVSQLTIIPFYDRTQLIEETLGTLEEAMSLQILITIIVILIMVMNIQASLLISGLLPISVLMVFIAMRYFHVDANIVALSGIAIAIGTMVDLGIILSENILKHIKESSPNSSMKTTVYNAAAEVSSAIVTAVSTTIVSFIPVFTMEAAEGKLFRPLAFTKTFALIAALLVTLLILPTIANWIFGWKSSKNKWSLLWNLILFVGGISLCFTLSISSGLLLIFLSIAWFIREYSPIQNRVTQNLNIGIAFIYVNYLLTVYWMPLGVGASELINFLFILVLLMLILGGFYLLEYHYERLLHWCLRNKRLFLSIPIIVIFFGATIWLGVNATLGWFTSLSNKVGWKVENTAFWEKAQTNFPGIGKEFMPSLDEGSFLLMPTSMPHSGMEQNRKVVQQLDMLLKSIPEVELAVGKMGRVESALDPAPISMYENIINYKPEYEVGKKGHRERFKVDDENRFVLTDGRVLSQDEAVNDLINNELLIPDHKGKYYRNWRKHIKSQDDIWNEIVAKTKIPGVTSAPKLQPIETRLVMLQTGMRAPMGIKVYGPDLATIENFGMQLESILKEIPSVKSEAVFADRIVGKPYIHLNIKRAEISRYGLSVENVQQTIETAIGGMQISSTVEGRERYPIRVRYPRELRDNPEALANILVPTPVGAQIPLGELVEIEYIRGPQVIKSENTFLVGYVLLDKRDGYAEVDVVEEAQAYIQSKIDDRTLVVPSGISYKFSGSYENQVRAEKRLSIIVPLVLLVIFLILYFQFKSVSTSLMIFSGIAMAFSGAFIVLWLYGQTWFLNFDLFGLNFQELFQIKPINLSVAVWVGFIALFGIATDDGVLMGTYLDQNMERKKPKNTADLNSTIVEAGKRRIKPAVMTSATTIIALLPILTSTGRGADIMIPMAIPAFGGMLVAAITYFIVPVLYSIKGELNLKKEESI